ncbi:hypothetical protein ACFE04_013346 [Oxalis oulophora]
MEENPNQSEAERLLGVSSKLLEQRDLNGSKEFAVLAQEAEPLLDGSDQILAICDVLIASDNKRINNTHLDYYSILQLNRKTDDVDVIKKQYRRLALLLHPDKNKFAFADHAFKLVADAWAVLGDNTKKLSFDKEHTLFYKVDLSKSASSSKLPVRRGESARLSSFWTVCPYCYLMCEYPRVYENCCLRCQKCRKAFHAVWVKSLPPMVPGREAYYCCWGFFPLGFASVDGQKKSNGFPNWMPPIFAEQVEPASAQPQPPPQQTISPSNGVAHRARVPAAPGSSSGPRKRGRPRKNPL